MRLSHTDNMKYTIKSIDEKNSNVVVVFDIDNKEQTLHAPLGSKEDLHSFLVEYAHAYKKGLAIEEKNAKVSSAIKTLVGEPQTAEAEPTEEPK